MAEYGVDQAKDLIQRHFGVEYHPHYICTLLDNLGLSFQKARFVSDHLDEAARIQWMQETWPKILRMAHQRKAHFEELLHQCGRCEASLHLTRIQLNDLNAEGSQIGINAVTETLRNAINQAKEVQEELRRLGY